MQIFFFFLNSCAFIIFNQNNFSLSAPSLSRYVRLIILCNFHFISFFSCAVHVGIYIFTQDYSKENMKISPDPSSHVMYYTREDKSKETTRTIDLWNSLFYATQQASLAIFNSVNDSMRPGGLCALDTFPVRSILHCSTCHFLPQ